MQKIAFLADKTEDAQNALSILSKRYGCHSVESAETIVALGGDGFMLSILHNSQFMALPVYGMNRGTVGFLMNEFSEDNLIDRLTQAEAADINPLRMQAICLDGSKVDALAINEVSLLRAGPQAAKLKITVDDKVRMEELVCDGALVSTPAGSTAYNYSSHGPILPIQSDVLALTAISAFRPRRWRGALLPKTAKEMNEVSRAFGLSQKEIVSRTHELHEQNPMLGHRGCRLGISFPEIYEMQCRAIFEALSELKKKKIKSAFPEIMVPLVSTEAEIKIMKDLVLKVANQVQKENKVKIDYIVGTMIELPRAAIKAKDIAKHAEFFSFGTNDLTQTTFGISRDDSGKFLNDYIENKIFSIDPFISIDEGVGDLIEIAVERGRKQNKKIKLGICGEHGGDPKSIHFCANAGLDYVSCSPYRVPIARLAAAQAELKE